jgi:hypothetical protein
MRFLMSPEDFHEAPHMSYLFEAWADYEGVLSTLFGRALECASMALRHGCALLRTSL